MLNSEIIEELSSKIIIYQMRELQVLGTYLQVQQADGLWCICVQFGSFQSKSREKLLQPVPQGRSLSQEGPL